MLQSFRHGFFTALTFSLVLGAGLARAQAHDHDGDHHTGTIDGEESTNQRVQILTNFDVDHVLAGSFQLSFNLYDKTQKKNLGPWAIDATHGAQVHVIIYDAALQVYRHVHPKYEAGVWQIPLDLPQNGHYFLWTQGKITADGVLWSSLTEFHVADGALENQVPDALPLQYQGTDGNSRVALVKDTLKAKEFASFSLKFDRLDGTKPELNPYLYAAAHLIIVDSTGKTLVHAHPMEVYNDTMQVDALFPHAGTYRVWVEFNDGNDHRVIPLAVNVE